MKTRSRMLCLVIAVVMIAGLAPFATVSASETELRTVKVMAPLLRPNSVHSIENRYEYPVYQIMAEELAARGIVLEFDTVVNEQYEVVLQTRLASGSDLADFIALQNYVSDANAVTYGKNGLFLDLNETFQTYDEDNSILTFIEAEFPEIFGYLTTEDDKMYWLSTMFKSKFVTGEKYCGTGFTTSIRKDWMDTLGLEFNTVMTVDELYDALVAFQESDMNGNGVPDEVIGIEITNFHNGIAQAFGLPTNTARFSDRSDEVMCPWYCDGITDYITFMKKLVDDGVFDTSTIGNTEVLSQMRAENKISLVFSYIAQTWLEQDVTGVDNVEYAPMFLTKAEGEDFILSRTEAKMAYTSKYVIPSSCKDVQAVVDMLDYVYTYDYSQLMGYGIEGLSFEFLEDGTKRQLYRYSEISDKTDFRDSWASLFMGQALPEINFTSFNLDRVLNETTFSGLPYKSKDEASTWLFENQDTVWSIHDTQPLSMMNEEETEILNRYETILTTYQEELLVDLILGNRPIENLDEYIAEMKSLGLDEFLGVFQDRHDRYVDSMNN